MDEQDAVGWQPADTRSPQSSQLGPYRQHTPETQFPLFRPARTSSISAAIYCRSMMSIGRGFPLWYPAPTSIPNAHMERGYYIGDVGCLNHRGGFQYYFNIFFPEDHPVQDWVPRNFKPIEPPFSEWKIQVTAGDISPGSILSSQGITATHISEQPIQIEFTSYAREGAVLILPEGATREDLSEPENLYSYLKEHASDWYQCMNGYSDQSSIEPTVNSSLFIITGTDRSKIWNLAQFPPNSSSFVRPTIFRYVNNLEARDRFFDTSYGTFFIRGISVALNQPTWSYYIAPIPLCNLPIYTVPSVPALGPRARLEVLTRRFRDPVFNKCEAMFHPAIVLLQILLEIAPAADIAIVQDTDWCPLMRGQSLDLAEFRRLVHRVLAEKEIKIKDGVAVFVQKLPMTSKNVKQRFRSCMQFLTTGSTNSKSERQALRKLNQLLSKPRIPVEDDDDS